jgi:hypothetical protein
MTSRATSSTLAVEPQNFYKAANPVFHKTAAMNAPATIAPPVLPHPAVSAPAGRH